MRRFGDLQLTSPGAVRALLVIALALPATGPAEAAHAALDLASAEPVAIDARVTARVAGGALQVLDATATGVVRLLNATGTVTVYAWDVLRLQGPRVNASEPTDDARSESFRVNDASIEVILDREVYRLRAVPGDGGAILVDGPVRASGVLVNLTRTVEDSTAPRPTVRRAPGNVDWRWDAGWAFLGAYVAEGVDLRGFPVWDAPAIRAEGALRAGVQGGNATVREADGHERAFRLGEWSEDGGPIRRESRARLVFEGTVATAELPAGRQWGLAGPEMTWTVEGRIAWTGATGRVRASGTTAAFRDATVYGDGVVTIDPRGAGPLGTGAHGYAAEGEWAHLRVGDALVVPVRADFPVAAVATISVLAALASLLFETPRALLARGLAVLYTRIAPSDLLSHPRRAAIWREVTADPGVHVRELARRVGGGWGIFRTHLRMLEAAGYVRTTREGYYSSVFPAGAAPESGAIAPVRSATARAILAMVPEDGRAVDASAIVTELRLSRQLVRYHLRGLAAGGHVLVERASDGATRVRRAATVAPRAP